MLSDAKHLFFSCRTENKSRFFSPAKSAGLQNDTHGFFTALLDDFDGAVFPGAIALATNPVEHGCLQRRIEELSLPDAAAGDSVIG